MSEADGMAGQGAGRAVGVPWKRPGSRSFPNAKEGDRLSARNPRRACFSGTLLNRRGMRFDTACEVPDCAAAQIRQKEVVCTQPEGVALAAAVTRHTQVPADVPRYRGSYARAGLSLTILAR